MSSGEYNLTINCLIDDIEYNLYFDYVSSNSYSVSSNITTHPLVNGDMISDHMYKNQGSANISGSFSIYGNKKGIDIVRYDKNLKEYVHSDYSETSQNRLNAIQTLFERINKEGILCSIFKRSSEGEVDRFKVRNNMVLTNIRWSENQFSVDFNFDFTEVLLAEIDEVEYEVDVTDEDIPIVTNPLTSNIVDELFDWNEITKTAILMLKEEGLYTDDFITAIISWSKSFEELGSDVLVGVGIGAVVGTVVFLAGIKVLLSIAAAAGTIPVAGWIIAAAVAAVAAISSAIFGIVKAIKASKYKIKAFKLYKNEKKKEEEFRRFTDFIGSIKLEFESLGDNISLYGFGINKPQECLVTIGNNYYVFKFTKATESSVYSLSITDIDGKNIDIIPDIGEKAIASINECSESTLLFTTSDQLQVYLINKKLLLTDELNESAEEVQKDLTNFTVIVSNLDLTRFNDMLVEIIKNKIFK